MPPIAARRRRSATPPAWHRGPEADRHRRGPAADGAPGPARHPRMSPSPRRRASPEADIAAPARLSGRRRQPAPWPRGPPRWALLPAYGWAAGPSANQKTTSVPPGGNTGAKPRLPTLNLTEAKKAADSPGNIRVSPAGSLRPREIVLSTTKTQCAQQTPSPQPHGGGCRAGHASAVRDPTVPSQWQVTELMRAWTHDLPQSSCRRSRAYPARG